MRQGPYRKIDVKDDVGLRIMNLSHSVGGNCRSQVPGA